MRQKRHMRPKGVGEGLMSLISLMSHWGVCMNLLDLARSAAPPIADNDASIAPDVVAPDVGRRRARALALLDAETMRRIAVIAEAGDPAHVTVAVRGVAVGDLEITAERYDGFALLALMQTTLPA